ncbi:MAG TPA: sulfotransferase [Actinomycetes bacterium]|nr:sulfotransferase [Actinomycetes bacterium]
MTELDGHTLVFVGGLHRSGTTPLARCLAAHPQVSGFAGTGVPEDEGQHLQSVYPPALAYGGPGRFARADAAHLTEASPLAAPDAGRRLFEAWRPWWDLSRPVLLEKSPPNLLASRFLQAAFPGARFVMVVRHPAVVSLSTWKWARRRTLGGLLDHWFRAHRLLEEDAPHLDHLHVVKYEHLVRDPDRTLAGVAGFLGLDGPVPAGSIDRERSAGYERRWRELAAGGPLRRARFAALLRRYQAAAEHFGYSLLDLERAEPFPASSRSSS